jgi:endonuclease/exonuclease/phosphatase family metal-dependent hydrolase
MVFKLCLPAGDSEGDQRAVARHGKKMLSALTFNMQNGQVWDEENPDQAEVSLFRAIEFLREQNADIIFLQEVERGYDGGQQIEPPPHYERLKNDLAEYDSVFGYPRPNRMEIPFGLGLAIFSKTALRNFYRKDLPPAEIAFEFAGVLRKPSHRLMIGAETQINGRSLRLINTHLQAFFMINASSNDHHTQRDRVELELRRCTDATLLGGDFNCAPGESLIEQFKRAGFRPSQNAKATWRRMPFVVDHIFYNDALRLEACSVIPTKASDHHAVRSQFSFAE